MRLSEERLKEIEASYQEGDTAPPFLADLLADLREARQEAKRLQEELLLAPTREQLQAVVAQLREVRGENAVLRAEAKKNP